jgi:hypothetical protein
MMGWLEKEPSHSPLISQTQSIDEEMTEGAENGSPSTQLLSLL